MYCRLFGVFEILGGDTTTRKKTHSVFVGVPSYGVHCEERKLFVLQLQTLKKLGFLDVHSEFE